MVSPFDDLDSMISEVVESHFGESAILHAMTAASQYSAAAPDPARQPPITVIGVLSSGPSIDPLAGQQKQGASGGPTLIASQSIVFWLSASTVAEMPWPIRRGDHVVFADDAPRGYRVVTARPTDMNDLELTLTEE